ncbi:hypothetical protein Prudu_161S000100, partial [Prunus dulcis]
MNCIGALDGTHILVTMSVQDRQRYRNRKGDISTNIRTILWMPDMLMDLIYLKKNVRLVTKEMRVGKQVAYNTDAAIHCLHNLILNHSGFNWDATKKMISVDEDNVWDEYVKVDDVSPNSSCPKRRNQNPFDIPPPKKRVAKMASSLEHFINSTTQKLDPTEVYNEVIAIPDLSPDEQLKACSWFIENENNFSY